MVSTRKRSAAAADQQAVQATPKRVKAGSSSPAAGGSTPQARGLRSSPATAAGMQAGVSVPRTGSRGAAFLAAAGIALPAADAPPKLSTKKESAVKARRPAAREEAAASKPAPASAPRRNPRLQQELPRKLQALLDMFAGMQTVYEVMRKRGQRTTFQNMRQAVEEASGRRFLLSHVAQLKHLLPEALELEWVKLPVAGHTSRTEAHLLITLDGVAAGEAAAAEGAAPRGGELQAARHLLHCRLAGHLLDSYRAHLDSRAAEVRQAGDEAAAADLEAACAAAAKPPVEQWVQPYPDGAADVPQQGLPPRPEATTPSSRAASPVVLGGAATAAGAAQLGVPATPATSLKPQATTVGRTGRPPVHPNTVERHRLQQRRLSFSGADPLAAAAAAAAAAAHPTASEQRRAAGSSTPLDKLTRHLDSASRQEREQAQQQAQQAEPAQQAELKVHPAQAALAASLDAAGEFDFGGAERLMSQEDADLLASMPEHLRRMSTDGIISLDTLRKLDAAEQQHRRLSSKEAVAAREASAALAQLPRTFSRLQRIFGNQGPNALKLRNVVLRIKQGAETTSEAQIEAQLRALAEHAPDYVSLRPYGACGTPALWVNRGANANAVMAKLREAAEGGSRRSSAAGM